jgi:endo-beta-N-acetylglucosaminidase D
LNEATLWTGGPVRINVNPGACDNIIGVLAKSVANTNNYVTIFNTTKGKIYFVSTVKK